jgi:SAM-dependent methyltransferase
VPAVDPLARAQSIVSGALGDRAAPRVLEAGCGARSHITYPAGAHVVGIDILRSQLRRRTAGAVVAQGDVAALPVASACADLVVCWDVLEHLPAPERAIAEIARVLRPGGRAVLALPNILSMKGLVTRFTPWWFHVWVYRRVLGDTSVGTDRSDQFPTAFRFVLRPAGLRRLAEAYGLQVEDLHQYEGPVPQHLRRRYRAADVGLEVAARLSRIVTWGRYDPTLSDMIVVLLRPEGAQA